MLTVNDTREREGGREMKIEGMSVVNGAGIEREKTDDVDLCLIERK